MTFDFFRKISRAPTHPPTAIQAHEFDIADLYHGPIDVQENTSDQPVALDEKLRHAYFWIVNNAIISPHYDIEYNTGPPQTFTVGDTKRLLTLPSDQSYSSFVLLPLLTFATRRKCLFIGGPGRGKTASAVLMGVLAGMSARDVRRAMQHGHPQMTIADLLGNPLPADLIAAQDMSQIRIAWRPWLSGRVKIIDEYNRIPTRTQSALLTVIGDNYAEVLGQTFECPESAWYLTANDEQGGGTYEVIEALRDRIDVIVQALAFNPRCLNKLLVRIEDGARPEEMVPQALIFTEQDIDRMGQAIRAVAVPDEIRRRLEFFASQFELAETAGVQFEYMTKDTARLSGVAWHELAAADAGRDRMKDLGAQTRNGVSVRNLMTLLLFSKALAWFRGNDRVELEDMRQILPFVLRDKLLPDPDAPFFGLAEHAAYRMDRIGWLRHLFDVSNDDYVRLDLDRNDTVGELARQLDLGLEDISERETRARLVRIEKLIGERVKGRKLYGHLYDDLLTLKSMHQRYTNYLAWLRTR